MNGLIGILILMLIIALIGFGAWAMVTYIPMPHGIRVLIIIVAVVFGILIALNSFGLNPGSMRMPVVR